MYNEPWKDFCKWFWLTAVLTLVSGILWLVIIETLLVD